MTINNRLKKLLLFFNKKIERSIDLSLYSKCKSIDLSLFCKVYTLHSVYTEKFDNKIGLPLLMTGIQYKNTKRPRISKE